MYYHLFFPEVPDSSVGKESACNAGDPRLIPGSGRSAGEGIGYPLQYSWASRVAQLVKNLPAMWETWVQSLGWDDPLEKGKAYPLQYCGLENSMDCVVHGVTKSQEDPLEKEMATHSSILAWRDRASWWATVHGVAKSQTRLTHYVQHNNLIYTHIHTLINIYIHSTILLQNLFLNFMIIHKEQIFQY